MKAQVVIWICAAVLAGANDAARADVITLAGTVVDADTAKPIPCRIHLEDAAGGYQVPEGHVAKPKRTNWEVGWQKDVIKNGERVYALLDDGKFTVVREPPDETPAGAGGNTAHGDQDAVCAAIERVVHEALEQRCRFHGKYQLGL